MQQQRKYSEEQIKRKCLGECVLCVFCVFCLLCVLCVCFGYVGSVVHVVSVVSVVCVGCAGCVVPVVCWMCWVNCVCWVCCASATTLMRQEVAEPYPTSGVNIITFKGEEVASKTMAQRFFWQTTILFHFCCAPSLYQI